MPDELTAVNLERVGFALLAEHPLALELAGVILLMALVGAVVVARKQIEAGEAETEAAAAAAGQSGRGVAE
jgi:NADH-quinone oxidoreductase subunit J